MTALESAALAWREGRLLDARRDYEAIVQADPAVWGAAFQLAWLAGVFGRLSTAEVRALDRPGLSGSARQMIAALDAMVDHPVPLEGALADWDIAALRHRAAGDALSGGWEARGQAAAKAGLYGVALACFEEAERREPNGAYWDAPAWSHSLPAQVDGHLGLVAHPFGP